MGRQRRCGAQQQLHGSIWGAPRQVPAGEPEWQAGMVQQLRRCWRTVCTVQLLVCRLLCGMICMAELLPCGPLLPPSGKKQVVRHTTVRPALSKSFRQLVSQIHVHLAGAMLVGSQ